MKSFEIVSKALANYRASDRIAPARKLRLSHEIYCGEFYLREEIEGAIHLLFTCKYDPRGSSFPVRFEKGRSSVTVGSAGELYKCLYTALGPDIGSRESLLGEADGDKLAGNWADKANPVEDWMMTVEQIVREVLEAVTKDRDLFEMFAKGTDPQTFSSGDLVFPANRLNQILGERDKERGQ